MERKTIQTIPSTGHEGSCCACRKAVLNRHSSFDTGLGQSMLHRACRIALVLLMVMAMMLCATGLSFAQLADAPWPMRGRDAKHTGQSPCKGQQFANLKWKFETGYNVSSSPAIGSDGTVYVGSDDNSVYALGRASGPAIAVSQTGLNFGLVPVGNSKQLTLIVLNVGDAPLTINSISSSSPEFIVSLTSFTIPVDSSQEVTVTFTPLSTEAKLTTLTITSSDPNKPNVTVYLRGNIAPLLSNGTVTPQTAGRNIEFTFKVVYTDADNDPPSKITVQIDDDEPKGMYKKDRGYDFADGKVYEYKTKLSPGEHTYSFTANDGLVDATGDTATYTDPTVTPNRAPVLSDGSVTPEMGHEKTEFVFKVIYTDVDNDPPSQITVQIDDDEPRHMYKKDWGYDFADGQEYRMYAKLSSGSHTYSFAANDGLANATGDIATHSGPTVGQNRPPVLSNGTVFPLTGAGATEFRFTVIYSDAENDYPREITIKIDDGEPKRMHYTNSHDANYIDGAVYEYTTRLELGVHTYSFAAKDWSDDATGNAVHYSGPTVVSSGASPALYNGTILPHTGTPDTEFTFAVIYL